MNRIVLMVLVTLGPPVAYGLLLVFFAWRAKRQRRRDFRRQIARQRAGRITVDELRDRLEVEEGVTYVRELDPDDTAQLSAVID